MTRHIWWLFSSRKGLIILCVIVVLGMGLWTGWSVDHRFGDAGFLAVVWYVLPVARALPTSG